MTFTDTEIRVSSDLENLEMSGNFEARRKSQETVRELKKEDKKSQGKVRELCCVKFIFGSSEHPNFENFLREHTPRPPLTVFDTRENSWLSGKVREKSENFIPSGDWTPCGMSLSKYQELLLLLILRS